MNSKKRNDARSAILCSRSVLSPYSLRTAYSLRTYSVLYTYCIRTIYADSADIRTPIWSAERVRSQYRLTLSAASAAYLKHEITFKIGLRIAAEIHRHITDTVRIQYTDPERIATDIASPRSATSVRRCEWGIKAARRDSISNLTSFGSSNLSCRRTQCRFI